MLINSLKGDFQKILNYKSDLETLVEEQTQHLENKNKRMLIIEDTIRSKDQEISNTEGNLRRQTQSLEEIKKKLTQAEVKLRQITNTTLKD